MAIRSKEFVGIAEGIRSHELSTKNLIESLKRRLNSLFGRQQALEDQISYLEAAIAAAYENTDEDGDPDYAYIAALEAQKSEAESDLSDVEDDIDNTDDELERSEGELETVLEEKERTLFEIQERARQTSQNISLAGGMYGAYAGVGSTLQSSFQSSLSALSQAAGILGGSVQGAAGSSGTAGSGGSSKNQSAVSRQPVTSAVATFSASSANIQPFQPSHFSTQQSANSSSASHTFRSKKKSMGAPSTGVYRSTQSTNGHTTHSFNCTGQTTQKSTPSSFRSNQASSQMENQMASIGVHQGMPPARLSSNKAVTNSYISPVGFTEPVARKGRNSFANSLIVQDWELGRYTEPSGAYSRKNAAARDYHTYSQSSEQYQYTSYTGKRDRVTIDPATVYDVRGVHEAGFWSYKNRSWEDYVHMASQIPKVQRMLDNGADLNMLSKRSDIVGACALNYFVRDDIRVTKVGNAYIFGDSGRHRLMAALIAGVDIPVHIEGSLQRGDTSPSGSHHSKKDPAFMERIKATPIEHSKFIAGASNQELQEYVMRNKIASFAHFGNLDERVSRELVHTIYQAKKDFPFLEISFVGSTQSRNKLAEKKLRQAYTEAYQRANPTVPIEQLKPHIEQRVASDMKEFDIEPDDVAVSYYLDEKTSLLDRTTQVITGISVNDALAANYETISASCKKMVEIGSSPIGCTTVKSVIDHEIAHQISDKIRAYEDADIQHLFNRFTTQSNDKCKQLLSTYAKEDIHEFIAEAWSEYVNNPEPRAIARFVGTRMLELARSYSPPDDFVRERERE